MKGAAGVTTLGVLAATVRWRAGCGGGIAAPDLFVVQRTGAGRGRALTLLVNEEGGVHCATAAPDAETERSPSWCRRARSRKNCRNRPSSSNLSLPARAGSVLQLLTCATKTAASASADNSPGPAAPCLRELALFVLQKSPSRSAICRLQDAEARGLARGDHQVVEDRRRQARLQQRGGRAAAAAGSRGRRTGATPTARRRARRSPRACGWSSRTSSPAAPRR